MNLEMNESLAEGSGQAQTAEPTPKPMARGAVELNEQIERDQLVQQRVKGEGELIPTFSVEELIALAREKPPEPIIGGLLFAGDICLIHGQEESYKSIFVFQMADSIASGTRLLRRFNVPNPRRVGIVETELHESQLGGRLSLMFPDGQTPDNLRVFGAMREFRSARSMDSRLNLVRHWTAQEGIEVLLLDIASDFFRGPNNSPSDEQVVASFFEQLRDMHLTCGIVRHDHKPRMEDGDDRNSNNRIRGSGEWKEDPEVVLWLAREDRRTNEVELQVGKLRYGAKPELMKPWFDAGNFRLTLLPPVIAVLEHGPLSRQALLKQCEWRFGLHSRKVDEMTQVLKPFLRSIQEGHGKAFELDIGQIVAVDDEADETAAWRQIVVASVAASDAGGDMQDCISSFFPQRQEVELQEDICDAERRT